MGTGAELGTQRATQPDVFQTNSVVGQQKQPESTIETRRDLQRKERFEKLIELSPSEGFGETTTPKNSAEFELSKNRSYSIKRTDAGYTVELTRQVDKKQANVSRYFFDKDGTFLAKVKVSGTGEQYSPTNSKIALDEVDRVLPKLGSHNEKWRKTLFR